MHNEIVYLPYIHMQNDLDLLLVQNRKQNRLFRQQNVTKTCRDEQKGKQLHTHISLYHVLFLQISSGNTATIPTRTNCKSSKG